MTALPLAYKKIKFFAQNKLRGAYSYILVWKSYYIYSLINKHATEELFWMFSYICPAAATAAKHQCLKLVWMHTN